MATSILSIMLILCTTLAPAGTIQAAPVRQEAAQPDWSALSPAGDHAVNEEGETWSVVWTAFAQGNFDGSDGGDGHVVRSRSISMEGSAVARYSTENGGNGWETKPFQWTVTDDFYEKTTSPCTRGGTAISRTRRSITDPNTPPFWVDDFVSPGTIVTRDDGSNYMQGFWFVHSDAGMPWFPYQSDYYNRYCSSEPNANTMTGDSSSYAGIIWFQAYKGVLNIFNLECDAAAVNCWWDYSFTTGDDEMPMQVTWAVRAHRLPNSPSITQEPELAESNVFLPGVPVDARFDGNLNCDKAATCSAIRRLESPGKTMQQEKIGPVPSGNQPKTINLGSVPPGRSLLTAQAEGVTPAAPDSKPILVAAKLPSWAAGIAGILAHKVGDYVAYIWEVKFPDPSIKKLYDVPAIIPFFGGKKAGVELPQSSLKTEAKSSGEVMVQGTAGGALLLGDSSIGVKVGGKANGVLDLQGVRNVKGEAEVKVFGKVSAKAPLVKAVPALRPAITAIDQFSPAVAKWLESRAKAQLDIEPSWAGVFPFSDKTGTLAIDNATIVPAIGIKVKAALKAFEGVLEAAVGVGGEVKAKFLTPPLDFKELTVNFLVLVEGVVMHFGFNEQAGYSCTFPGSCQAVGDTAVATQANTPIWSLTDRSYIDDPDYDHWSAPESILAQAAAVANAGIVDIELAGNVYPQAHPTLARNGSQRLLLWSHDAPGKAPTGAQEVRFSVRTSSANESWTEPAAITNDNQADFNRELVFTPDGDAVAVWQRFDSETPGDMNVDPQGYLSHVQIGASSRSGGTWSTPQQLSISGSLNMRPALAATPDGAMAVWIGNASNQLIGDSAHPDIVYSAVYTDNTATWGPATPVLTNVSGLLTLRLAGRDNHLAIVYSRDMDGDFGTDADREIFYMLWNNGWEAPLRLTNNQLADESPLLVWSKEGTPQLVWQQGEKLLFLNGNWNIANAKELPFANPGDGLQLANDPTNLDAGLLALSWEQVTGLDTRIGYAIYDDTHALWSQPQTLQPPVTSVVTGTSTMVTHISSGMEGSRLFFAYQMAEVKVTTGQVGDVTVPNVPQTGKYSLRYAEIGLERNMAIAESDITVTPLNAGPGEQVTIAARVHNTGQLPTAAAQVDLVMLKDYTIVTQPLPAIAGGDSVTVTFSYKQPVEEPSLLQIQLKPDDLEGQDESTDNEARVVSAPLFSTIPTVDTLLGPRVGARFEQQGAIQGDFAVNATLHLDSENGATVGEALTGFTDESVTQVVTTTVLLSPTQLGPGPHLIYWVGDNGLLGISAANIHADLSLDPDFVGVDGNQISAMIANLGNLTSQGGMLQVYDQDPSVVGATLLAELPIPAIVPGKTVNVTGAVNSASGGTVPALFYLLIKEPENNPDLNPSNDLQVIGTLGASATPPPTSLLLPLISK